MILDPLFASGSERAEQENCALIANQNVRGIRDNLQRTAHGCVLLLVEHASGNQNRKSAFVSGAVVETVCTLCHISLSAYHRASPKRRLVALSRCPDADRILPAAAIGWNGTKVLLGNQSRSV